MSITIIAMATTPALMKWFKGQRIHDKVGFLHQDYNWSELCEEEFILFMLYRNLKLDSLENVSCLIFDSNQVSIKNPNKPWVEYLFPREDRLKSWLGCHQSSGCPHPGDAPLCPAGWVTPLPIDYSSITGFFAAFN